MSTEPAARARVTLLERIDAALRFGRRFSFDECEELARAIQEVAASIAASEPGDPALAASSYEILLAACDRKLGEVDDHYLDLDHACSAVVEAWLRAREAAGADPGETAARVLARLPLGRHSAGRPTGRMLTRPVIEAVVRQLRARPATGERERRGHDALLREMLVLLGDVDGYLAQCGGEGGGEGALRVEDCRTLAKMLGEAQPERAIAWLDRALEIDAQSPHRVPAIRDGIASHRSHLLVVLGRADEALALAWTAFEAQPRRGTHQLVMHLAPEAERPGWHARAMDVAAARGTIADLLLLLDAVGEHARLAERITAASDEALDALTRFDTRIEASLDPRALHRIASRLAPSHPDAAAKLEAVVARIGKRGAAR